MAKRKAAGTGRSRARRATAPARKRSAKTARRSAKTAKRSANTAQRSANTAQRSAKTAQRSANTARKRSVRAAAKRTAKAARPRAATRTAAKAAARRTSARASGGQGSAAMKGRRAKVRKKTRKIARPKALASRKEAAPRTLTARKAPALDRERRIVSDEDDLVPTPPSTLDLDRTASAARTGRKELRDRFREHTETSPAMTGGDIDADWESAYSVGDEAPGGDNPTPDQDIVDDIGRAVGVEYEDNEELKGEKKISDRDRKRWELDPASSEDYEDR